MNKTFYVPMSFDVKTFRKTTMMKRMGGPHFRSMSDAMDAKKRIKPKTFTIDTVFAGLFRRQPITAPAVYAIFEVSLPDYLVEAALHTPSICRENKRYGKIFAQLIEPEHLMAIHFFITEDILHPAETFVITAEDGFIHGHVAERLNKRIQALTTLAEAANRTPKNLLAFVKWNHNETYQRFYGADSVLHEKPWMTYPHGLFYSVMHSLAQQCGLEISEFVDRIPVWSESEKYDIYQSKEVLVQHVSQCIDFMKESVSEEERQHLQTFQDNLPQEVENIWWDYETPNYVSEEHCGHVKITFLNPVLADPDGYHGTQNHEMELLWAFGSKTYLITGELRKETIDMTPVVPAYINNLKKATKIGGEHQKELAMFLTAIKLTKHESQAMRHYAREVRNELFPVVFNAYPEIILTKTFHERLYTMTLIQQVEEHLQTELRMRASNAAILLRESGVKDPKAVVLGSQQALKTMKTKYPLNEFAHVDATLAAHMQCLEI